MNKFAIGVEWGTHGDPTFFITTSTQKLKYVDFKQISTNFSSIGVNDTVNNPYGSINGDFSKERHYMKANQNIIVINFNILNLINKIGGVFDKIINISNQGIFFMR